MNNDFEISNGVLRKYKGKEKNVVIPDGMIKIEHGAFKKCYMSSVRIPEGVTIINRMAFYDCQNLVDIILPNSLKIIKEQAFCYCRLNEISLPDSLTNIGDRIFDSCHYLDEITIFGELFDVTTDEFTDAYDYYKIADDYGFSDLYFESTTAEVVHQEKVAELLLLLIGGEFDKLFA